MLNPPTDPGGDYVYRTTFDLTGFDPNSAVLTGQWAVDDTGVLKLNGDSTGVTAADFSKFYRYPHRLHAGG